MLPDIFGESLQSSCGKVEEIEEAFTYYHFDNMLFLFPVLLKLLFHTEMHCFWCINRSCGSQKLAFVKCFALLQYNQQEHTSIDNGKV